MGDGKNLEVEVKFLVADLTAVRRNLLSLGATIKKERVFERNIRFDTPDEQLLQRWELLRLRQDSTVRVTFKGPAAEDLTSEAKVREEIEITVDDFDKTGAIFQRLGFIPKQTYEKYRETIQLGNVEAVLDEMPFGDFVELEGTEAEIKTAASQLGLDWGKRVLNNYLGLMGEIKKLHNLPFDDLTFANFKTHPVKISDILPICD
ncbi:MAG: class IV adenylate cyclase [Chloroflexi bacterium]|nr:class IV adenylate cyclase [Chloroflexota bacterium]